MNTYKVQKRDMETKAKRLRREGFVTGNLFGKEIKESIPLKIERKEAERLLRECMKGSQALLDLEGTTYDVLVKEMDYDSMKNEILEMDFQALVKGEKVHSVAEIVLLNKEKVVGGVVDQHLEEIAYKAEPSALVEKVIVDCSNLKLGDTLKVADLEIAKDKDIDITTHMDAAVVSVIVPRNAEIPDDDKEEETAE